MVNYFSHLEVHSSVLLSIFILLCNKSKFDFICKGKDLGQMWSLDLDWNEKFPLACSLGYSYIFPWVF